MLEKVRLALRIRNVRFDEELIDLIEEAKTDLSISGIVNIQEEDPLIQRAVKTYCKAHFGIDNKDSEKYQIAYDMLKQHLALCNDYNGGVVSE